MLCYPMEKLKELYNQNRWRVRYCCFPVGFSKGMTGRTKPFIFQKTMSVSLLRSLSNTFLYCWTQEEVTCLICFLEVKSFAKMDFPLRLSKMTCSISTASCWKLKWNRIPAIFPVRALRKFDGWIGFKFFFWINIIQVLAFEMGDVIEDSNNKLLQRTRTVLNVCKIKLA